MQQHLQDVADAGDAYPESPSYYFDFDAFAAHYSGGESDDSNTPDEQLLASPQTSGPEGDSSMAEDDFDERSRAAGSGWLLDMAATSAAQTEAPAAQPPPASEPYDLYALEAQVAAARSRYDAYYSKASPSSSSPSAASTPEAALYASPSYRPLPEKENWEAGWAAGMSRDRAIVRAGITTMHRRIREAGDCVITDYGQYMMLCEQQRAATDWHQIALKETNMMQALYRGSLA